MKHALLGASSASRWLNCAGSARLTEHMPDTQSPYAEEGTLAHEMADEYLTRAIKGGRKKRFTNRKFYNADMKSHVESYVEYVMGLTGDQIFVEQKLDYGKWVPDGFGTGDALKVDDNELHVIDFKYGQGVKVDAVDNPQLKLYALGAISALGVMYDFEMVHVHIYQPRTDPGIVTADYDVPELLEWAEYIKPLAQKAYDGVEEFRAGSWCQWCKAKATCKYRLESDVKEAFGEMIEVEDVHELAPKLMSPVEIAYWLGHADKVIKFLKDLKDYAEDQAVNHGTEFDGFKLVEGRSNRVYDDEDAVAEMLDFNGFAEDVYMEPRKILRLTNLKKAIGAAKFKEIVEPLLIKPPGKPTLVPLDDKRPRINSLAAAEEAFKDI